MLTESEKQQILKVLKEQIVAAPRADIGPVTESPTPDKVGIWIPVVGEWAYLGASQEAAFLTAKLSDWWIPERDGELTQDDTQWFEQRAKLGDNWMDAEIRMYQEERRRRVALNVTLATDDDSDRVE